MNEIISNLKQLNIELNSETISQITPQILNYLYFKSVLDVILLIIGLIGGGIIMIKMSKKW